MNQLSLLFLLLLTSMVSARAALIPIDGIAAIVDDEVVTQRELKARIKLVTLNLEKSGRNIPSESVLQRQVLDVMINDSLLLQEAARRGIKITDTQVDQAMQNIARQNKMSLSEYRETLISNGLNYQKYRDTIHNEIAISALRQQYGRRQAIVTDADVDAFINLNGTDKENYEYRLAHILLAVADAAPPESVRQTEEKAREILSRLNRGVLFEDLANTFSSGESALQGGDLGWRKKAEIPTIFAPAVLAMKPGEFAGPIRSASGFHIVYLRERRDLGQVLTHQMRSRHILIKPNELITEEDARQRLLDLRKKILAGEDFARLARLYSIDYNSGAEGGDIGWKSPGELVPEYHKTADALDIGSVSEPFRTRFGWHILEVTDRRTVDETTENKRRKVRKQLLRQKQREVFDLWKKRLRDQAYIVFPAEAS